jgi:hypothetical protein
MEERSGSMSSKKTILLMLPEPCPLQVAYTLYGGASVVVRSMHKSVAKIWYVMVVSQSPLA